MTTMAEIRADLVTVLSGIPRTQGGGAWNIANGYVGDQLNEYSLKVSRRSFDPRMVFTNAKKTVAFQITAYAPRGTPEVSEKALDALCEPSGSGSLIAAVQTSSNWSVTLDYAQVTDVGEVQIAQWSEGVEYLALPFTVEVCW